MTSNSDTGEKHEDKYAKPDPGNREDDQERSGEHGSCSLRCPRNEIVSSITTHSAEKMNFREALKISAIMKASDVMVGID